jgi:hypothetical protein
MKIHKDNKYTLRKKCKIIIKIVDSRIVSHRLLFNDEMVYRCDIEHINSRAEYVQDVAYIKQLTADALTEKYAYSKASIFLEGDCYSSSLKIVLYCENLKISLNNKINLIIDDNKFISYEQLKNRNIYY